MGPHSLDHVLDFTGFASTVTVIVWTVYGLQPLFESVKDSCRACRRPEGRALLLWSAFLVPIAWVAAAALYFRCLITLWELMGAWLDNEPVNRPVYALLHLYLFFLLVFGFYALAVTIFETFQNRKVLIDLLVIARFGTRKYRAIEDLEAQHDSSSTNPTDAEAENPSGVGDMHNTSPLPRDEGSRRNCQDSDEDVAPAEVRIDELEHPNEDAAWAQTDRPVGEIITTYSLIPDSSEAARPSHEHHMFDSDADTITNTPSSSSSNASSGIDEVAYADLEYNFRSVRRRVPLQDREQGQTNAFYTTDQRGNVEAKHDDKDTSGLYHATPRLSPQRQKPRIDIDHLDIGQPPSPCDSCSSTHAESIPIARRSPARVPITPTSPTADAEDADTEKTDVERKLKRERKNRSPAISAPRIPRANMPSFLSTSDSDKVLLGIDPNGDSEENTRALEHNLAAHNPETRARFISSMFDKARSKRTPMSVPPLCTPGASPPVDAGTRENGLFWRSREADRNESGNAQDNEAHVVFVDDRSVPDTRDGTRGTLESPATLHQRSRQGSPYPFAEGQQATALEGSQSRRDLRLETRDVECRFSL